MVRCPFAAHFEEHRDPARFAREYIPTLRSWSESTFASGLSPDRPPADCAAILDRFYDRYEAKVREAPHGHAMDYVHCYPHRVEGPGLSAPAAPHRRPVRPSVLLRFRNSPAPRTSRGGAGADGTRPAR